MAFFLQILLKKLMKSIEQYALHVLAFLPFSFSQTYRLHIAVNAIAFGSLLPISSLPIG